MTRGSASAQASAHWSDEARAPLCDAALPLLLHVVGRGGSRSARRGAPIEHPHATVAAFLEPHPEIQALTLEEIRDLLERLLAEVLHLQDLAFRLPHEI